MHIVLSRPPSRTGPLIMKSLTFILITACTVLAGNAPWVSAGESGNSPEKLEAVMRDMSKVEARHVLALLYQGRNRTAMRYVDSLEKEVGNAATVLSFMTTWAVSYLFPEDCVGRGFLIT